MSLYNIEHIIGFFLQDFATPSLKAAVMHADNEDIDDTPQDITEQYQIVERKAWETRLYMQLNYSTPIHHFIHISLIVFTHISFSIKIVLV